MKCTEFQVDLAEYVAGRLPSLRSAEMQAHAQECGECAREEAGERALRSRFALTPPTPFCPDLWPQVVSRRHTAPARQPAGLRLWAFGSASATFAVLTGLFWIQTGALRSSVPSDPPSRIAPQGTQAAGMLQMVADLRRKPLEASDALLLNIQTDQNERSVLLGSRGPQ